MEGRENEVEVKVGGGKWDRSPSRKAKAMPLLPFFLAVLSHANCQGQVIHFEIGYPSIAAQWTSYASFEQSSPS